MKEYWDKLFEKREKRFGHEKIFEENLSLFKGKNIVEIGAGDGRNSLYLAEKGFSVTAIDYSTVGINKINSLNPKIDTKIINVEQEEINLEEFNLVLFIHYFPSFTKFLKLIENAKEETLFFIYTFVKDEVEGNKKEVSISHEEIEKIKMDFNVLNVVFFKDNRGKMIYILIKK